jgi:aquaporin Z
MPKDASGDPTVAWRRRISAEVFGTFALVFVAAGGDTMARVSDGAVSDAARAVAPALIVAALIYAISDASGAHFNPAVSLAFTIKGLFPIAWLPVYWIAQLAGAILAAAVLRALFGDAADAGVTRSHVELPVAFAIEAVLTWLLVTVILGTADRARVVGPNAAIAVGATIAACGLIALPIEGASMNPARSLGPALVTGDLSEIWVYVGGPVAGAVLAVIGTLLIHDRSGGQADARTAARGTGQPETPT